MLGRKTLRDMRQNFSQFITIFLMVVIGVGAYAGIKAYMTGMEMAAEKFYTENNLQDLNVMGENFSTEDLEKIRSLGHVQDAERKLSLNATSGDKTLNLNFIESNNISKIYVLDGEEFDAEKSGLWLDNFYAEANEINVGDELNLEYDGYSFAEKVMGLVNVPDHLYDTKDSAQLIPDHESYGFAYLSASELEGYLTQKIEPQVKRLNTNANFDYRDYLTFTHIMVDLDNKENYVDIKAKIEEEIPHALAVTRIEDSASYATYQGEIDEGKTFVGVFSGLFIAIAMLAVVTTMTRIVDKQKLQIGTLKALGFSNSRIVRHYLSYGFYIAILGAVIGLVLGYSAIGQVFMNMQMSFFQIPNGVAILDSSSYIVAVITVIVICLTTYLTVRKYLKRSAADLLRNTIPNGKTRNLNITTKGIFKHMPFGVKWNLRDIVRNKLRTLMSLIGIVSCAMLLVAAFGMIDSMQHFIDLQFGEIYNFQAKLTTSAEITVKDRTELIKKYGKATSQTIVVETKENDEIKTNNIFVTDADEKVKLIDDHENEIEIQNDGVYITYKLSEILDKSIGDTITWHKLGENEYYETKIIGFNYDPQNQNISMTREYYESLGFEYEFDSLYSDETIAPNETIAGIETISDRESMKSSMSEMLEKMQTMVVILAVVAIVLGTVIIYSTSILSYSEKQYQFATLKVLGFKDNKIKHIFVEQNLIISIIAIILGLPAGYYFVEWMFTAAVEENFDFGAYIESLTYVLSAIGVFVVSVIVSRYIAHKINKIDMVSSLKANE